MSTVLEPLSRPSLSPTTERQRCVRCVMDTSDPEIVFDAQGICNHCHKFDRRIEEELFSRPGDEHFLEALVERIRAAGKNRSYDVVLGLSGGVDSSYVALVTKRLGLRGLAVHMDNGWNSELAVANIEQIVSKCGFDLYTHVVRWEEFRDLHASFLRASIANSEVPTDHAIVAIIYKLASRHGIRYIMGGGNLATESVMPASWMYDAKDLRHIKSIHRQFGSVPLKTFPTFNLAQFAYWTFARKIRTIPLLNYVPYDKAKAQQELQDELGWRPYGGKHYESIYTRWFQAYLLPSKFGIDKRLAHYSSLILSGQMSRAEALESLAKPLYHVDDLEKDTDYICKKLEISRDEFNRILRTPARSYRDFASNEWVLRGMPKAIQYVKRVATERPSRAA